MRSACLPFVGRLALPLLFVLPAGCSSDKDRVEKQLSKLREDIQHLQSQTDRMGERLDAMETRQAAVPHYPEERVASAGAGSTLSRPKLKVVRMEPGAELPAAEGEAEAPAAEGDSGPRVLIQGEGKSIESRTVSGPAPAPAAAKTAKPDNVKAPKAESGKAGKSDGASSK